MTEDEAKTKMCCGPLGTNMMMMGVHIDADEVEAFCIGSDCMAWRWLDGWEHDITYESVSKDVPPKDEPKFGGEWVWISSPGEWQSRDRDQQGFCGLAGKP